jgi:protease-4
LVGLDPEKTKCFTIEEPKPLLNRLLPSSRSGRASGLAAGIDWVEFELSTSGQPLWLYRP